jgi:plastocyanin
MSRRSMLLVLGMLLVACGGGDPQGVEGNRPPPRTPTESPSPEEDCPAQTTIIMNTRSFDPTCVEVAKGDTLRLQNDSDIRHSFTLDRPKVDFDVMAGDLADFTLGDLKKRQYRFDYKYHSGMFVDVVVT